MGTLDGKVALVTGAGAGIGRAAALKLASEGAAVVVNALHEESAAQTTQQIADDGRAVACAGDVAASGCPERLVAMALDQFGSLDIIVNAAGYVWDGVIQNVTDEQLQAMLDVHLIAPLRILRAASDYLRAQAKRETAAGIAIHRKVVNVSSIAGLWGNAGQTSYGSAKMGVVGLTRCLAKEWGRYRVNVNCVAFGPIETRVSQPLEGAPVHIDVGGRQIQIGVPAQALEHVRRSIPLGRLGTVEEAAGAIYLLCLKESNFISGEVLVCAGGAHGDL